MYTTTSDIDRKPLTGFEPVAIPLLSYSIDVHYDV